MLFEIVAYVVVVVVPYIYIIASEQFVRITEA